MFPIWLQVLAALDRAFSKLGFTHADMRISNVMEHSSDAQPMYPKGFASRKQRKTVGVLTEPKTNTFQIPGERDATVQPAAAALADLFAHHKISPAILLDIAGHLCFAFPCYDQLDIHSRSYPRCV